MAESNPYEKRYRQLKSEGAKGWGGAAYDARCQGWRVTLARLMNGRHLPLPPATLLELGCGNGMVAMLFAVRGYRVTGVDISDTAVDWARARFEKAGHKAEFYATGVESMDMIGDASMDVVVDGNCLHCTQGEQRRAALGAVKRITRPGGVFVVSHMVGPPHQIAEGDAFDAATSCYSFGEGMRRHMPSKDALVQELCADGWRCTWQHATQNAWWDHVVLVLRRQ